MPSISGSCNDTGKSPRALLERALEGVLLLDGATGTELESRGVASQLPLWSTHALLERPDVVRDVHAAYAAAGARVLTANTFRTQARTLGHAGMAERASELTTLAVRLAREGARDAASRTGGASHPEVVLVAGSAPPLEDCYHPERVPGAEALRAEHDTHARCLAEAGVDLILVETMNCVREAIAAASAAAGTGLPFVVSFVCDASGNGRLLSGEGLDRALRAVEPLEPHAVAVNCLPPSAVPACLPALAAGALPFGVYANLGAPSVPRTRREACSPADFAELATGWVRAGARMVGGCCGTTPEHIAQLAKVLDRHAAQP